MGSETTFLNALCLICPPGYLVWSKTFLLGVGIMDLGDFGRYYWGQNKAIVVVYNGLVVYCNVGVVLIFLARAVVFLSRTLLLPFSNTNFCRKIPAKKNVGR